MSAQQSQEPIGLPQYIDRPDLQTAGQRTTSAFLAALGWMCWIYLFLPLLTLLGWAISYRRVDLYVLRNKDGFFQQIHILAPLVMVAGAIFLIWALYNLLRFRGRSRRFAPPNISIEKIAAHFELDTDTISQAQQRQTNIFYFDADGEILDIVAAGRGF